MNIYRYDLMGPFFGNYLKEDGVCHIQSTSRLLQKNKSAYLMSLYIGFEVADESGTYIYAARVHCY
jgi:hypothetical protein